MGIPFYSDIDLNGNQLLKAAFENLAADPTGLDLYAGRVWFNTTDNLAKIYDGTAVRILADRGWVTSEINKLERIQGSYDASSGLLPTAANKISGDLTQVVAGDYWIISVAGTIAGIVGADQLAVGDKLQYVGGGAANPANWVGIQTNLNDADIGNVKKERQTVNLVANTPLNVNAAVIADIHSVQTYDAAGNLIYVEVQKLGGGNQRTLTSKKSLTGVVVEFLGS